MSYVTVLFVDITLVKTVSLVILPNVEDRLRENLCSNCPDHNYTCKEPQLFSDKNCEVIGIHFLSNDIRESARLGLSNISNLCTHCRL